jgi:predicted dehydrogenase
VPVESRVPAGDREPTLGGAPRLGFLGTGWIGRNRMEAVARAGAARVVAIADVDPGAASEAAAAVGCGVAVATLEDLLEHELDGIVIATPTAMHRDQALAALGAGVPVFCQKPLGRDARECAALIDAARGRDLALGVDMSYRHLAATQAVLAALAEDRIGPVHAAELTFHNAYGPDKPWARDPALSGGGALIDLGCHLLDLAELFGLPLEVDALHADLFAGGRRLGPDPTEVEDLALAQLTLRDGRSLRLACSWWLPAGRDAVIEATLTGARGALRIANVAGSFYDFEALWLDGTRAERLVGPPDDWGGRAITAWARQLSAGGGFDPAVEPLVRVASLIDRILGRPA